MHVIVYGTKNVGKLTLVRMTWGDIVHIALFAEAKELAERLHNSIVENQVVCVRNIDILRTDQQRHLCSLIDVFHRVRFVFTTRTNHVSQELKSRCSWHHLKPPTQQHARCVLGEYCSEEHINSIWNDRFTMHDLLIALELRKHNIDPTKMERWKLYAQDLCDNLHKLDTAQIRTRVYKLHTNLVDTTDLIYECCTRLIRNTEDTQSKCAIAQHAAHFEHANRIGNKDVYHIEAFLLSCKKLL